ncbi:ADP-ribosylglycohydrolase family protein [Dermatophilaceae bacterium Soc4.6]
MPLEVAVPAERGGRPSVPRFPSLYDAAALTQAARRVSALTPYDRQAQDACAPWSVAIRHAVLRGELDLRSGLTQLGAESAAEWATLVEAAEDRAPDTFTPNGGVVTALQAEWSAIVHTRGRVDDPARHFRDALETTILIGDDTDTVAAIAGGLLGAGAGLSSLPVAWTTMLHGYPGITADDLRDLADRSVAWA